MRLLETASGTRRLVMSLAITLSALTLVLLAPIHGYEIAGHSMEPRLHDGERILVEGLTPLLGPPGRGEIVVFVHPRDPRRHMVKRVVGLPGETVELRDGGILVDGRALAEDYLSKLSCPLGDSPPVRLPASGFYLLGDHRCDSEDSRSLGQIPRSHIVGRAVLAYWPPSAAGRIR